MSFNGNKMLRAKGESVTYTKDQIEMMIRSREDILWWAENFFHIISLDKGKIKIPLYHFQKKLLKCFCEVPDNKRHVIVLASRQVGKTTTYTIYCLWRILFFPTYKILLLANKERNAIEILDRIKMAFSLLPKWMQVGVEEWNEKSISFENLACIEASSTSSDSGRSGFYHDIICDEFSFISPALQARFTASTFPVISSGTKSKVIMVSTANGMETFYNLYTDAIRGLNNYYPVKVLWSDVPGRGEEWRKEMCASLPGKELQFSQEFDCKFFGASNTLIDNTILEKLLPISPIELKWGGLVQIYEAPIAGKKYILSCDPGGGTGKNYSVIQVLKVNKMRSIEQVAMFRSNTHSPYDLCQFIIDLSDYYNKSMVIIENNSDIGGIVCSQLFYQHEFDRLIFVDNKIGVRSTKQSKAESNFLMKRYIEHGWLKINDRTTIYELSLYKEQSIGIFYADNNCNDDTVTALMWSLYAIHLPNISPEFFDDDGNALEGNASGSNSDGCVAFFD